MEKDNCTKQQDIDFIVELLRKQSPEKYEKYLYLSEVTLRSSHGESVLTGSFLSYQYIA